MREPRVSSRRAAAILAIVGLLALGAGACGSDDEEGGAAGDGGVQQLNIAIAASAVGVLERIAAQEGLFEQNGLDVTLQENTGQNTPNILAAGRADLAVFSIGAPASLAAKGLDISIIYALTGGSQSASVFAGTGPDSPKSLEDLKGRDGCTIVTQAVGSAAYGNAVRYNREFALGCKISPLADPAAQVGALAAGRADAVVGTAGNFAEAIEQGEMRILVDTSKPEARERYLGQNYPLAVVFGVADRLDEESDAIVRYIKAVDAAAKMFRDTPTDQLVEQLKGMEGYEGMTPAGIALSLDEFRDHFQVASSGGYITEPQWDAARAALGTFNISGLKADTPAIAYDEIVDTAYYRDALGEPADADANGG